MSSPFLLKKRPSTSPRPLLLVAVLALGGCLDDCGGDAPYDPQPGPGELGNGEFHYRCIGDGDPACSGGSTVGDFPARVAVGGRFELQYTWNDDDASQPPPDLRSGAADRLRLQGEIFTPLASGYTAVLALLGNSDIGDLIHIHASAPTAMAIQHQRLDYSEYVLPADTELRFDAVTRDDSSHVLAGLLQFTWEVDDPAVARLVGTGDAHVIVRGLSAGTTSLRATLGDLTAELVITVEPGAATTGADTTDSSSTGDTGDTTADTGDTTGDSTTDTTTGGVL